jgi:ribose transport system substrate-binding protein
MIARAAAVSVAAVLLCGCGQPRKKIVGVVPKSTAHVFWVTVETGARAAAYEHNLDIIWNGPPLETDHARQIRIIESLIARRVDGIAVAASDRKALVASLDRAAAQGIPVTIFDSGLDSTNYLSYVATDNYEAGRTGARELGRIMGGRGKAALIMHMPGSVSTLDRERGFEDVMAREFPAIQVVARQYSMASRARARDVTENILTAHSDLDGLFSTTEPSSTGAALALHSRGKAGKVKFVGFDFSDSMINDLQKGVMDAMVVQDAYRIGFEAVRTLAEKLAGGSPPKRVDLPGVLVTRENLEKPEIQKLLHR